VNKITKILLRNKTLQDMPHFTTDGFSQWTC